MEAKPTSLEVAILKTLIYADIFDFPLTVPEIHHFLIGEAAPLDGVQVMLDCSPWLEQHVTRVNGYCAIRPETAELRHQRDEVSRQMWEPARRYGVWLAHLPFVRMVALTGALAMRNAHSHDDDFDYLILAVPGRVWL